MSDNTKYEVNRRYPFDEGTCPVDGDTKVAVWRWNGGIGSGSAKQFGWGSTITHFLVLEYQPETKVRWVNVYGDGCMNSCFYKTREEADICAARSRTECLRVEYVEGEGL